MAKIMLGLQHGGIHIPEFCLMVLGLLEELQFCFRFLPPERGMRHQFIEDQRNDGGQKNTDAHGGQVQIYDAVLRADFEDEFD